MADDVNPILRAVQRAAEDAAIAQSERKAWNEAAPADRLTLLPGTTAGDEERLRKLPVCAPGGWGGVIPGTHPERETIRRITQSERAATVQPSSDVADDLPAPDVSPEPRQ